MMSWTACPSRSPRSLELGERSIVGARRVSASGVREPRLGGEHGEHLLGIRRPVGRDVQVAAGLSAAPTATPRTVAGSGAACGAAASARGRERRCERRRATRADHALQHLHRVVLDDADVPEPSLRDQLQQAADAGRVHFDAEVVVLRVGGGNRRRWFRPCRNRSRAASARGDRTRRRDRGYAARKGIP